MAGYPVKGKPRDHQIIALTEANLKPGHAWFCDPGAGKTYLAIAEAGLLFQQGKIDGVMIFAPNGVHQQWIDEQFPEWCGVRWRGLHNKQTPGQIKKWMEAYCDPDIMGVLSLNYDALRTVKGKELIAKFREMYPRIYLVVDESHKVKNPTAIRTKETLKWAMKSEYRRILSGTPVLKGLEDLWSQYEVVGQGITGPYPAAFNKNGTVNTYGYLGYRGYYCIVAQLPNNPRAKMIVGYRNEEELRDHTRPYATRIKAADFMKNQPADTIRVPVPMNTDQTRQYNLMRDHLISMINRELITAQNALVQLQKLQQIANGFLYDSEHNVEWISDSKIEATLDLVDQLDEPLIIFAPHRALMLRMADELPDAILYSGRADLEHWDKVMIGNQASGLGVGLNLQKAAATIYMANSFSSEARWQSLKRTDRIGQKNHVRYWDLISPGTVDDKILDALDDKEDIATRTIDGLRSLL